jgi:protein SCO1/2
LKLNRLTLTLGLAALLAVLVFASMGVQRGATDGGKALVGGAFQLVDQSGAAVDQTVLDGRWSAVFFGFTQCPDVCPGTLQALSAAAAQLTPAQAKRLQVVFISVDPERDTPAVLKAYLESQKLPVTVVGLTGAPAQIKAAAGAYRVFYEKAEQGGGAYTMNHSTAVYLMDRRGRFDRVLAYGLTPQEMAEQIGAAMRGA